MINHFMSIQERIRERLDDLGLSMKAASLAAGLGETAVKDLLRNEDQSPKVSTIEKLAPVLETTMEWIITGKGDKSAGVSAEVINIWSRINGDADKERQFLEYGRYLASKNGE